MGLTVRRRLFRCFFFETANKCHLPHRFSHINRPTRIIAQFSIFIQEYLRPPTNLPNAISQHPDAVDPERFRRDGLQVRVQGHHDNVQSLCIKQCTPQKISGNIYIYIGTVGARARTYPPTQPHTHGFWTQVKPQKDKDCTVAYLDTKVGAGSVLIGWIYMQRNAKNMQNHFRMIFVPMSYCDHDSSSHQDSPSIHTHTHTHLHTQHSSICYQSCNGFTTFVKSRAFSVGEAQSGLRAMVHG